MDLIERQAALDCFHDWIDSHGEVCTPDDMPEYRAIEALPSADLDLDGYSERLWKAAYERGKRDAERKKGKWIVDKGLYKCSSCNGLWVEWWAVAKPIEHMKKAMPYCPMCGAEMVR